MKLLQISHGPIKLGQNAFGCPFCTKICKKRGNMNLHIRTHTGIKPFQCSICNYSSADQSNLIRHMQTSKHIKRHSKVDVKLEDNPLFEGQPF